MTRQLGCRHTRGERWPRVAVAAAAIADVSGCVTRRTMSVLVLRVSGVLWGAGVRTRA